MDVKFDLKMYNKDIPSTNSSSKIMFIYDVTGSKLQNHRTNKTFQFCKIKIGKTYYIKHYAHCMS